METWKQKAGILVMVLCLGMVLAALWYCLFIMPGKNREQGGTLVQMVEEEGRALAESEEGAEAKADVYPAWPGRASAQMAAGNVVEP